MEDIAAELRRRAEEAGILERLDALTRAKSYRYYFADGSGHASTYENDADTIDAITKTALDMELIMVERVDRTKPGSPGPHSITNERPTETTTIWERSRHLVTELLSGEMVRPSSIIALAGAPTGRLARDNWHPDTDEVRDVLTPLGADEAAEYSGSVFACVDDGRCEGSCWFPVSVGTGDAESLTPAEAIDQIRRIFRDQSITDRDERLSTVGETLAAAGVMHR